MGVRCKCNAIPDGESAPPSEGFIWRNRVRRLMWGISTL